MHIYIISNTQGNLTAFLVEILKSLHFTKVFRSVGWCWHLRFSGWPAEIFSKIWKRKGWLKQEAFLPEEWCGLPRWKGCLIHDRIWCLQWLLEVKRVLTKLIAGKLINDSWHYSWQWPALPVLPLRNICTLPQSPKQSNEKSMLTLVGE